MSVATLFWGYTININGEIRYEGDKRPNATYNKKPYVVKPYKNNKGYLRVQLWDPNGDRRWYLVHRLLAIKFVGNPRPDIFNTVDHIDGDPLNNSIFNLRWVNRELNMLNLTKAKNAYYNKRWKKWQARVRGVTLGWFSTEAEAMERSRSHRRELFTQRYNELTNNVPTCNALKERFCAFSRPKMVYCTTISCI